MMKAVTLVLGMLLCVSCTHGQKAEAEADRKLAGQAIVDTSLDTLNNLEILRRLEAGDIESATELLREIVDTDRVELEQLSGANVSAAEKEKARSMSMRAQAYLESTSRHAPK